MSPGLASAAPRGTPSSREPFCSDSPRCCCACGASMAYELLAWQDLHHCQPADPEATPLRSILNPHPVQTGRLRGSQRQLRARSEGADSCCRRIRAGAPPPRPVTCLCISAVPWPTATPWFLACQLLAPPPCCALLFPAPPSNRPPPASWDWAHSALRLQGNLPKTSYLRMAPALLPSLLMGLSPPHGVQSLHPKGLTPHKCCLVADLCPSEARPLSTLNCPPQGAGLDALNPAGGRRSGSVTCPR